jgi:predicted solute-binding protein
LLAKIKQQMKKQAVASLEKTLQKSFKQDLQDMNLAVQNELELERTFRQHASEVLRKTVVDYRNVIAAKSKVSISTVHKYFAQDSDNAKVGQVVRDLLRESNSKLMALGTGIISVPKSEPILI